jgi:hypothetical protein
MVRTPRFLLILVVTLACTAACSGERDQTVFMDTADQWLEAMRAAGERDPDSVIEVRRAYLASTT